MQLIRTKNFELATMQAGNEQSNSLAIVIPGRLDTKDYAHNISHVKCFGKLGFFAVAFDPPGTWESPGSIDLYTTTNYLKATNELIEHFGNRPTVLLGHSRGGTISILMASRNELVQGFVAIMPNFGPPTPAQPERIRQGFVDSYRDLPPGITKEGEKVHFQLPINYITDGQQYDVMNSLQYCDKPKLLFCGTRDEFESPKIALTKCQLAADPKRIVKLDVDHDYRRNSKVIEQVNSEIEHFVRDYSFI